MAASPAELQENPKSRIKRSPELADSICQRIVLGCSLTSICEADGYSYAFVCDWLKDDPSFVEKYAQARSDQADYQAEQIVDLAMAATPENAHVVRLQVDTLKWRASKMKPKVYGDRPAETHVTANTTLLFQVNEEKLVKLQDERKTQLLELAQPVSANELHSTNGYGK